MTGKEELYLMVRRGRAVPVGNVKRTRKIEGKLGTVVSHKSTEWLCDDAGEGRNCRKLTSSFTESRSDLLIGKCVGLKGMWRGSLVILVLRK